MINSLFALECSADSIEETLQNIKNELKDKYTAHGYSLGISLQKPNTIQPEIYTLYAKAFADDSFFYPLVAIEATREQDTKTMEIIGRAYITNATQENIQDNESSYNKIINHLNKYSNKAKIDKLILKKWETDYKITLDNSENFTIIL